MLSLQDKIFLQAMPSHFIIEVWIVVSIEDVIVIVRWKSSMHSMFIIFRFFLGFLTIGCLFFYTLTHLNRKQNPKYLQVRITDAKLVLNFLYITWLSTSNNHVLFINKHNHTDIISYIPTRESLCSWSYGSWIYNYLCYKCMWVWIPHRRGVVIYICI